MKKLLKNQVIPVVLFVLLWMFILPFSAKSQCKIETLPYTEGFSSFAGSSCPDCWGRLGVLTDINVVTNQSHGDANSLYIRLPSATSISIAVMPEIVENISLLYMSFAVRAQSLNPKLDIGVMTDPTDSTTFEVIKRITTTKTNDWFEHTIYFSDYTGYGKYIAFRLSEGGVGINWIDSITIDRIPTCKEARNLVVSNIGGRTAFATWDPSLDDASEYEIEVSDATDIVAFSQIIEKTSALITGLYSNTNYNVAVRAKCGSIYSTWLKQNIQTAAREECTSPNLFAIRKATDNSAVATWVEDGTSQSYILEYRANTETDWIQQEIHNAGPVLEHTITGLTPNTEYTVRIKVHCLNGDSTAWMTQTFLTPCMPYTTLPFVENFDNTPGGNSTNGILPLCWSFNVSNTNNKPYVASQISSLSPDFRSAPGALNLNTALNTTNIAILPPLVIEGQTMRDLQVNFSAKVPNANGTFLLGIMDDPSDVTTFTTVSTIGSFAGNNIWKEFAIPLTSYEGAGNHIAFMWKNAGNAAALIDNIYIDVISECATPIVTIDSTTNSSVYFSWVDTEATAWEVVCVPAGTILDWNSATAVTGDSWSISGLTHTTRYDFYLRAKCDANNSFPAYATFTTACGAITLDQLPYTESFDTYNTGTTTFPTCWNRISTANTSINTTHFSAPGALYFNYASIPLIVATPEFDVAVSTLQVEFKLRTNNSASNFIIGVMTNPTDSSTFVPVDTVVCEKSDTWENHTVYLNTYPGDGKYIAFRVGSYRIYLDDLAIYTIGTCIVPTKARASNISPDQATIAWDENGTATAWKVAYGPTGFNPDNGEGFTFNTDVNPVTISSLTENTLYDVYVKAICGEGDTSAWSRTIFTLRTAQIPSTIPYVCDFENSAENAKWTLQNGTQVNQWCIGEAVNNTTDGSTALYISNSNGAKHEYVATTSYVYAFKTFDFPTGVYELSFDWRANGEATYSLMRLFLVPSSIIPEGGNSHGMSSAINNVPNDWTDIGGGMLFGSNTWTNVITNFSIEEATTYHVVILWKNANFASASSQSPGAIDNISIRQHPCPHPHSLALSSMTQTDATITWSEQGTATDWEVQYGLSGFALGTGETAYPSGTPNYTISELLADTDYDVYVRSICNGTDHSDWSAKMTFKTLCAEQIIQIPYFEDFDSYDGGTLIPNSQKDIHPTCWITKKYGDVTDAPFITNMTGTQVNSAPYVLDFGVSKNGYSIAILPEMGDAISMNSLQISFWGRINSSGSAGKFSVGVMDNPYAVSTFTTIDSYSSANMTFQPYTVNLEDYQGTGRYIAFKWEESAQDRFFMDDLAISYNCASPAELVMSDITTNSATVSWTAGDSAISWSIEYKRSIDTTYNEADTINVATYSFTELFANTDYDVRIKATCNNTNISRYATAHFKTLPITYTIIATAGLNGTISPADTVTVNEGDDQTFTFTSASGYTVDSVVVDGATVEFDTVTFTYTLENIRENKTIHVEFKENLSISQYNNLDNSVLIYPNPASDQLKIRLSVTFKQLEIVNLLGQVVYTANVNNQELTVDVTNYHSGVYFIRLNGKQGVATKTFIKE